MLDERIVRKMLVIDSDQPSSELPYLVLCDSLPVMNKSMLQATVVIASRNRKDELATLLRSCLTQDCLLEILVMDDASEDGTSEMIAREFPSVRLNRSEERLGQSARRTQAASLVRTEFIVSLDDDTELRSTDAISTTLREFSRPDIAVVAMPFIDVRKQGEVHHQAPDRERIYITNCFVAAAFAIRTEVFRQLNGYRSFFLHRHEESDFSIRLMDAGYYIRLGNARPTLHYVSPRRDSREITFLDHRNILLYAWLNLPWHRLPREVTSYGWRAIRACVSAQGLSLVPLYGHLWGLCEAPRYWRLRHPVNQRTVVLDQLIFESNGCLPIEAAIQ